MKNDINELSKTMRISDLVDNPMTILLVIEMLGISALNILEIILLITPTKLLLWNIVMVVLVIIHILAYVFTLFALEESSLWCVVPIISYFYLLISWAYQRFIVVNLEKTKLEYDGLAASKVVINSMVWIGLKPEHFSADKDFNWGQLAECEFFNTYYNIIDDMDTKWLLLRDDTIWHIERNKLYRNIEDYITKEKAISDMEEVSNKLESEKAHLLRLEQAKGKYHYFTQDTNKKEVY